MEGFIDTEDLRYCHCCGGKVEEERGGRYCMACAGKNGFYKDWNKTKAVVQKEKLIAKQQQKLFV